MADNAADDLLFTALCAAGLDDFTTDATDEQPSTSTASNSAPQSPAASSTAARPEPKTPNTPLPGITASASTSPDLPINAASQISPTNAGIIAMSPPVSKPFIANATTRMIKVVRADGKEICVPLVSSSFASSFAQSPVRIVTIPTKPTLGITSDSTTVTTTSPAVRPVLTGGVSSNTVIQRSRLLPPRTSGTVTTSGPVGMRPPTSQNIGQYRLPAAPFLQRIQQPRPMAPAVPVSTQRPATFVRSRLIPAVTSTTRQPPPSTPLPILPSVIPKRSRLVHFNPNVGIMEKPPPSSSQSIARKTIPSGTASNNGNANVRFRLANDIPKQEPRLDSGMSMVGPMRPMLPARPDSTSSYAPTEQRQPRFTISRDTVIVEEEDEEELGLAETYADYIPAKLRSGLSHPDQVVETSSLSSVLPPDVQYHVSIPEEVIDTGKLSALQLEAVIYACQKTECILPSGERCGYLIGDGPGVGKGRTIAGFIYENYLLGRKRALWFSVSSDLKYDSERDLRDIGAGRLKVYSLNKFKYSKISGKENGSIKKGVIFATYSSLIGESQSAKSKYRSRLKQLLQWCGKNFDGVIVFDECHRAKNLIPTGSTKPTKTGQTVLELQKALPKARILYASATGASETRNMAYMTRLGLWGPGKPFKDFNEFISAVEKRGVGAMEIVAMDMKLRGLYLARQLSFAGVTFRIEEVPLSDEFTKMYDESVKLWLEARKQFRIASELINIERSQKKAMWSQFWAAHQRFFKYLCIAAKVKECVRMVRENVKNGKCVVIGLQSTGEARTLDQLEESGGELTDFISTAKGVFQALIERHFPTADQNPNNGRSARQEIPDEKWGEDEDDFLKDLNPNRGAWKRKLVTEHRERKKKAKLERDVDEGEECPTSSSSSDDDEKDGGSENERSEIASDSDHSSDDDNETDQSQSETDSSGEAEDTFNPFADDMDETDPWENKIKKSTKRKKKRKPERDEELERQLEQALQEAANEDEAEAEAEENAKNEKKAERLLPTVSANDFFSSTSSYIDPTFKPGRFATELGLDRVQIIKAELLAAVERLGETLPPNTLDQLIDELGGPEYVAEMTGRKGRVVSNDGEILYELRNDDIDIPLELMNVAEKERFMNGEKHIAIISEAASSGISLQSDRRAKNQRRRVHITLELPWSADKAIQQFGRTHRSNQVSAPEYIFLISELAGEYRFASVVAKRLESLGALTHGDRRATESRDLSQFNLDTKYGRQALEITLKSIVKQMAPIAQSPASYQGEFFNDMRQYLEGVGIVCHDDVSGAWSIEKDTNLAKFLNRLLGLPVLAQNSLFQYFSDTLHEVIEQAKRDCRYDLGIMDLGHGGEMVRKTQTHVFYGKFETGSLKTELHTVMVERGLSWEEAFAILNNRMRPNDGFYVLNGAPVMSTVILVSDSGKKRADNGEKLYHIYRPNIGLTAKMELYSDLKKRFKKITPENAEPIWRRHYDASAQMCQHEYWFGRCRTKDLGLGVVCDVGRRKRAFNILSGSVLTVWNTVEHVLSSLPGRRQSRMQVVRVRTDQGQKIVGILVPQTCKRALIEKLAEESSRTSVED